MTSELAEASITPADRLDALARPKGGPIVSVCLGLLAVLATYFVVRSFVLVMTQTSVLPIGDIYFFYSDYFSYLDGNYSFWRLLGPHNEHLILTTRLALLADTAWFAASGKFGSLIAFVLVFVTSLMMAYLAATPNKWERAGLALVFVGLGCSAIQLDNLSLPFQLGFFFVHAFALATLIALWRGLQGRYRWYIVAFACDLVATFSLGSGVLSGVVCLGLPLWSRRFDRWFAIFLAFHLLLVLLYVALIETNAGPAFDASTAKRVIAYFLAFLGNFAVEWPKWTIPVGAAIAAVCAGLFAWLSWRALFCGIKYGNEAVIAAFAGFVILEAMAASVERAHLGVDYALSLKYTTVTLLLVASLFAFVWRTLPQTAARVAALLILSAVLLVANSRVFENGWRERNRAMDAILAEINDGRIAPGAPRYLGVQPDLLAAVISRLRQAHLGPFRATN
ncbi:MAG: hypothetical protein JO328_04340 [Hyphomicrobiales bacterium]|nr:hypothetical protein [Hyphomicrobiales bacterium]MBV9427405.1 hypothetical protein [Bradyrhizobiaceae bacterium]